MAIDTSKITVDIDLENRVGIVSATSVVHATSQEDCLLLIRHIHDQLAPHLNGEKGYLILDYSKIWIEPEDITTYAETLYSELKEHVYENGYARYGLGISRVTSKRVSQYMEDRSPLPVFYTQEEAKEYISGLIAKRKLSESRAE